MSIAAVLDRPVLAINKNWVPIRVTNVKEAICLVCKGTARIIDPDTFEFHDLVSWNDLSRAREKFGDAVIRSVRLRILPPEVIVLTAYDGLGDRAVVFSRRNLFKRDHYTCVYCGAQPGTGELTVDHIRPRSRGGTSSWENCVLACLDCNKKKADRTPDEAGMTLRRTPKKPSWKVIARVGSGERRESWERFISRAYWDAELEP